MTPSLLTNIGQVILPAYAGGYALTKKDWKGCRHLLLSLVINQICLEILKRVTGITRPNGSPHSFPSGHTAASFVAPAFLICRYSWSDCPASITLTSIGALLVGIGRVIANKHWPSDVLGGMVLGPLVTFICTKQLLK